MTTYQIIGLVAVAAVAAWQYVPWKGISLPAARPDSLKQVAAVIAIRESNPSPEIRKACNELLRVMLDTK